MIKVNELFAGIGAFRKALIRTNIPHSVVGISEIDKFAIKSYEAIYGKTKNYGDISKVDKLDYADLWTYGFPCQDISVAGKQEGIKKGKTRSGLLYEVERLLEKSKECGELPKYLMLENVKNLVGKKFKPQFEEWLQKLDELGFNTYWQVLNAKHYGVPQNRERVFAISIRKDIDTGYEFPKTFDNGKRLKDILEKEVDEKYYISNESLKKLITKTDNALVYDKSMIGYEGTAREYNDVMPTITLREYKEPRLVNQNRLNEINQVGILNIKGNEQIRRVYADNGISPTLNTMQGGNRQPKILEPCIAASRGRNPEKPSDRTVGSPTEQRLEINKQGVSNTITTVQKDNYVIVPKLVGGIGEKNFGKQYRQGNRIYDSEAVAMCLNAQPVGNAGGYSYLYKTDYRIRKLTPKECWRLMGFTDEQFQKAEEINSNSQLYKQAGNSIVVNVLEALMTQLLGKEQEEKPVTKTRSQWLDELLGGD